MLARQAGLDGRGSCSTAARARPSPCSRHCPVGPTRASRPQKSGTTLPCLHSWEHGSERSLGGQDGTQPVWKSQPQLPWSLGGMLEGHCASCSESQDTALPGSTRLSRASSCSGAGRGGMGQPSPRCFLIKNRALDFLFHLFYCLYGLSAPKGAVCFAVPGLSSTECELHQSRTVTVLSRKGWD